MTRDEIALVLTKCASYDRRTIGRADVLAWHEAIGDLPLEPALRAVAVHHGESTEWCRPGHLRRIIRAADTSPPSSQPAGEVLAQLAAAPFDELANRRGLAAVRAALAHRSREVIDA